LQNFVSKQIQYNSASTAAF